MNSYYLRSTQGSNYIFHIQPQLVMHLFFSKLVRPVVHREVKARAVEFETRGLKHTPESIRNQIQIRNRRELFQFPNHPHRRRILRQRHPARRRFERRLRLLLLQHRKRLHELETRLGGLHRSDFRKHRQLLLNRLTLHVQLAHDVAQQKIVRARKKLRLVAALRPMLHSGKRVILPDVKALRHIRELPAQPLPERGRGGEPRGRRRVEAGAGHAVAEGRAG
mmetsp:Transcript_5518/g.14421  ORF Transcript_5518/g.14421 Transcript_5518/m.14421 type:complete len:222 (+) Transcript_5518:71-736(+)